MMECKISGDFLSIYRRETSNTILASVSVLLFNPCVF